MTSQIQSYNSTLNPANDRCLEGKGKVVRYIWVRKIFPLPITLLNDLSSEFKDLRTTERKLSNCIAKNFK